ncbi:MAG TPA: C39 family peptidase [Dehalococcoidia bacterium]|nr:C39 family peptidase [Dehalococcoidia bacterium]
MRTIIARLSARAAMAVRAPRRLVFGALLLAGLLVPALGAPRPALGRDLTNDLPLHYIHQYQGNASDDVDCGPASIAMVLTGYGVRPAGLSDAAFVATVRRATGEPASIGTVYDDLKRVFDQYGLRYDFVPSSMPGEPAAEAQAMRDAVAAGNLVIAEVHGVVLGRSPDYGDHWLVVVGFDGDNVHVLDPDDQRPRWSGWIRGGDITLPLELFEQAMLKAQPGPYGIVIHPPARGALHAGVQAKISGTDGDGAFLRNSAGMGDNKIAVLPEGSVVSVVGPFPAPNADGHDWIGVVADGQQGFVAAEYLTPAGQ